ncbi:hypothetical protein [Pseudanabaena sp. FACHB-2040]|uniref:hypothetical protein n=1 Tax=Pseudanabaena sp. FACHB-2040 TaxID=2692859 RepID=UPI001684EF1A|nr:hypothetical protein [Pseudanabaena sp. FACHB-2040]MBD2258725.1 hypothetical protein [Pseudanabaena sp. FACHB-2040]
MPEANPQPTETNSPLQTPEEAAIEAQRELVASAATDQQPLLNRENDPVVDETEPFLAAEE